MQEILRIRLGMKVVEKHDKYLVTEGFAWRIGDGRFISIWNNRWIGNNPVEKSAFIENALPAEAQVSKLNDVDKGGWCEDRVRASFIPCEVDAILGISLSRRFLPKNSQSN
ncbi:conserved hypothetical protein [Ricinus communis]|uniref:Uncharacterized protein n=1 Tax=Ricinus communis TaxID=3988 RepID=B9SQD5_RICCO|nr:conserved hypothetical protein [Ricinus communis]